jgi:hypothetical protein
MHMLPYRTHDHTKTNKTTRPKNSKSTTSRAIKAESRPAVLKVSFMPSVNSMDPSAITAPELPEVNVAGAGEFELFFDANVEPEKHMAYIVSYY